MLLGCGVELCPEMKTISSLARSCHLAVDHSNCSFNSAKEESVSESVTLNYNIHLKRGPIFMRAADQRSKTGDQSYRAFAQQMAIAAAHIIVPRGSRIMTALLCTTTRRRPGRSGTDRPTAFQVLL